MSVLFYMNDYRNDIRYQTSPVANLDYLTI